MAILNDNFKFDCWTYGIRHWWGIWHIREGYHNIKNFFFPKQAWLVKGLYHNWCDKPELIEEILYRCIVNYVEEEKCFEYNSWDNGHTYKECSAFIADCYDWIKVRRPKLVERIDNIISNSSHSAAFTEWVKRGGKYPQDKRSFDEIYPNLTNLENELRETNLKYLTGIVKWREYLWT